MNKETVNENQCPLSDKKRIESVIADVFGDARYKIDVTVSFCNKVRVSIVYWDFLPEKEVMQLIGRKLPGVEVLLGRDYDTETIKNALMEMCENDVLVWCYDLNNTPYLGSPFDLASAWLADKRISHSKEGKCSIVADRLRMLTP